MAGAPLTNVEGYGGGLRPASCGKKLAILCIDLTNVNSGLPYYVLHS